MNNTDKISEAKAAWDAGQHDEAIRILETNNELKQDDELINVLIHFYVENEDYKDAIELIHEQPAHFIDQQNIFKDYFKALVQTNTFGLARKELFNHCEKSATELKLYLSVLEKQEEDYIAEFPKTVKEKERDFYHIGDRKIVQQAQIIEQAYYLPWKNFKRAARFNLLDPFLNQVTRVSILKDLTLMQMDEEVEFIWIDEKSYKVVPTQLKGIDNIWNKIKNVIENDSDPIQSEMLLQQAKLLYDLSYPFPERVLPTSKEWLTALKKQFYEQKQIKSFDKLNQIIISIIEE
jgi:hypothetical protein